MFTESLSAFLQSHLGVVVDYAEKYGVNIPLNEDEAATARGSNNAHLEDKSLAALLQSQLEQTDRELVAAGKNALSSGTTPSQSAPASTDGLELKKLIEESLPNCIPELKEQSTNLTSSDGASDFDSNNLASFISERLKSEFDSPTHGLSNISAPAPSPHTPVHPQFAAQTNQSHHSSPYQSYTQGSTPTPPIGTNGETLPPNQSMPTAALYEKARQAAVAKSSNTTRREGLHSTRRPWTPEEEKALMAGLDMVKGPHWSQILSLFGPNGTISDILKDRTQVQLKDKARNLKLFFLKTNSEMPYYLQSVTGELKTRAPGQAARKEAEEKARMNLADEQARIEGIMTLAGGLQNNHTASNAPLAASPARRASPSTAGYGGSGVGMATPSNGSATPRIKTEFPDQHSLHKATAFPPIQPAPAPASSMQQGRNSLPPLQPQPGPHQQQRPQAQQQYNQPSHHPQHSQKQPQQQQQPQQPPQPQHPSRLQEAQKPVSVQQQQQYRQQAHPQYQPQPQQPSQSQTQPQAQQPQPQVQQRQQLQAPSQSQGPSQVQPQVQPQAAPRPPSVSQPAPPQPASPQVHQARPSPSATQAQPLPTPPIPPNHHSTPDHAQDTKMMETLQAAIAASTANDAQPPVSTATMPDGSTATN
ncbi:hypothetical protein VTH06DRAFT_5043 [Thermothelomyces fergusii]